MSKFKRIIPYYINKETKKKLKKVRTIDLVKKINDSYDLLSSDDLRTLVFTQHKESELQELIKLKDTLDRIFI